MVVMLKSLLLWVLCLGVRLAPWRPANVEPILACLLPLSRRAHLWVSLVFPASLLLAQDVVQGALGIWTPWTMLAYSLCGLAAWAVRSSVRQHWFMDAALGAALALTFDVLTLPMGPLLWGQSWVETVVGQVPFSLRHALGAAVSCGLTSTVLQRWLAADGPGLTWLPLRPRAS
jgi:hypothetical protein